MREKIRSYAEKHEWVLVAHVASQFIMPLAFVGLSFLVVNLTGKEWAGAATIGGGCASWIGFLIWLSPDSDWI